MSKNYLKYLYRSKRVGMIFIFLSQLALMLIPFISGGGLLEDSLIVGAVYSGVLTFVLPMIEFAFVHKKKSIDSFMALPVSRSQQLHSVLIYAFSVTAASFLINSLIAIVIARPWIPELMYGSYGGTNLTPMGIALSLIVGVALIAAMLIINSLLYLMANSVFDGVASVILYSLIPVALYLLLSALGSLYVVGYNPFSGNFDILNLSPAYLSARLWAAATTAGYEGGAEFEPIHAVLLPVYTALAYLGLRLEFVRRKTERAEQLSDRPYAYPFLINAYAFIALFLASMFSFKNGFQNYIVYFIVIAVIYVIAHFIYRRKIQVRWQMGVFFAATVAAAVALSFAADTTRGFGLSYAYDKDPENMYIQVHVQYDNHEYAYDQKKELLLLYGDASAWIDRKNMEDNRELLDLVEKLRQRAIENGNIHAGDDYYKAYYFTVLEIYENNSGKSHFNGDSYRYSGLWLTPDELRTLARYGGLKIQDYNGGTVDVEEFIEILEAPTKDQFIDKSTDG